MLIESGVTDISEGNTENKTDAHKNRNKNMPTNNRGTDRQKYHPLSEKRIQELMEESRLQKKDAEMMEANAEGYEGKDSK